MFEVRRGSTIPPTFCIMNNSYHMCMCLTASFPFCRLGVSSYSMHEIESSTVLEDAGSTTRRGSLFRKILPVRELLKSRSEEWNIYSATQNLPSVLNDPNNRELDLFTRTWGDGFVPHAPLPPMSLPCIELGDFLCYLRETASVSGCGCGGYFLSLGS